MTENQQPESPWDFVRGAPDVKPVGWQGNPGKTRYFTSAVWGDHEEPLGFLELDCDIRENNSPLINEHR